MEFLQLSKTTRAREIDAELKKNKWRNEWLDPTRAWVAPGPLLDIFLFFSKTKIFHSHPCLYAELLQTDFSKAMSTIFSLLCSVCVLSYCTFI